MKKTKEEILNYVSGIDEQERNEVEIDHVSVNYTTAIEAMEIYAAQFTPVWIDVKERLPEAQVKVLVVISLNGFTQIKVDFFRISDSYGNEKKWFNYFNVTHWMPLPELPQPPTK